MKMLPEIFIKSARSCGMSHLIGENQGHFFVDKNRVLSSDSPRGVELAARELKDGVQAEVLVKKGVKIKEPLFFCFGLSGEQDRQRIIPKITLEENSELHIAAHCGFPKAKKAVHEMEGVFEIGKGAKFVYHEAHYHGEQSGARVWPKLKVRVGESGIFESRFVLSSGTVGQVKIELSAVLEKNAKSEIETKVLGQGRKDKIEIVDRVELLGEKARSLIKMRAAARGGGTVLMQGETFARARDSFGHVDCQEIVIGQDSVARAVPIVEVSHAQARVTHEASVGKINQKELETLMTRGLDEDQATDLIVNAMMA